MFLIFECDPPLNPPRCYGAPLFVYVNEFVGSIGQYTRGPDRPIGKDNIGASKARCKSRTNNGKQFPAAKRVIIIIIGPFRIVILALCDNYIIGPEMAPEAEKPRKPLREARTD